MGICKECLKREVCVELCDEANELMPKLRKGDAVDLADESIEESAEKTLKMQEALDLGVQLENLGQRPIDEETGLPPCKLLKLYQRKGLV